MFRSSASSRKSRFSSFGAANLMSTSLMLFLLFLDIAWAKLRPYAQPSTPVGRLSRRVLVGNIAH